jgi:hypothetical protein
VRLLPAGAPATALVSQRLVQEIMTPRSDQRTANRRGCYVVGLIVLATILLFGAIGMGWLGDIDLGKISGLPIFDKM